MTMVPKKIVSEFCNNTSAHGFARISNSHGLHRIVWICLTLFAFAGAVFHFSTLYVLYASHSKWINTQSRPNAFVFPDITFCPTYPFSYEKTLRYHQPSRKEHQGPFNSLKFWIAARKVHPTSHHLKDLVYRSLRSSVYDYDVFKNPQDHIIHCMYRNDQCSYLNFTIYRHPRKLFCFTFSPDVPKLDVPGPSGSLKVILNLAGSAKLFFGDYADEKAGGYEISIHERKTRPSFFRDYLIAQTSTHLQIGVSMQRKIHLNIPAGKCGEQSKNIELIVDLHNSSFRKEVFPYNMDDCPILYKQQKVLEACGCLFDNWIINGSNIESANETHRLCHDINCDEVEDLTDEQAMDYVLYNASARRILKQARCFQEKGHAIRTIPNSKIKCYRPCTMVFYKANSFSVKWPVNTNSTEIELIKMMRKVHELARSVGDPIDPALENYTAGDWQNDGNPIKEFPFVSINIYATSLAVSEYSDKLAMSLSEFIAGVGGMLGLWIGFSVITVCEIFYLFGNIFHSLCRCSNASQHDE